MATSHELMAAIGGDPSSIPPVASLPAAEAVGAALGYDRDQVFLAAKGSLDFLAGLAAPDSFQFNFPPILKAAWQLMLEAVVKTRDFTKLALGIPRGHAKTTLVKLFILHCILFTDKKMILVISSKEELAENIIADVVDMLNEPNIISVFGDWKLGIEKDTLNLKKFGFRGRNIILYGIGALGAMRGVNLKNERPDVMIFEDVQTRECADSKVQSDALMRWMLGTAMKAKSPFGCFYLFVGNMYPTDQSILKQLRKNPAWTKFINGAILEDNTALWEELQPLEQLLEELENDIAMGHPEIFMAEVLNDDTAGANSRLDFSKITSCDITTDYLPQAKFIVIDPSGNKAGADDTSIGLFYIVDGVPVLVHVVARRLSPLDTINETLLMGMRYGAMVVCVEAQAYQETLNFWFEQICEQRGISGFLFCELYNNHSSKNSNIANAIKSMNASQILIGPTVRSLVLNQLLRWNPLKRDNDDGLLDLLAMAPKAIALYGPAMVTAFDVIDAEAGEESTAVEAYTNNCPF